MRATTKMHSMRQVYKYAKYVRQLGRENEMGNGNGKYERNDFPQLFPKNSFVNMLPLHCVGVCSWQFCIYSSVLFRISLKSSHCGNRHAREKKKKKTNRKVAKSEPESPKRTPFVISFAWAPHKFLFLFSVVDFLFIHFIFFATTGEKKSLLFRYCSSKLLFLWCQ